MMLQVMMCHLSVTKGMARDMLGTSQGVAHEIGQVQSAHEVYEEILSDQLANVQDECIP